MILKLTNVFFAWDVVYDEHASLCLNTDQKSGLKFIVKDCHIAEKTTLLHRSTKHKVGKASRNNVAAEISQISSILVSKSVPNSMRSELIHG